MLLVLSFITRINNVAASPRTPMPRLLHCCQTGFFCWWNYKCLGVLSYVRLPRDSLLLHVRSALLRNVHLISKGRKYSRNSFQWHILQRAITNNKVPQFIPKSRELYWERGDNFPRCAVIRGMHENSNADWWDARVTWQFMHLFL